MEKITVDDIIAKMLSDRNFLLAMQQNPAQAVIDEFGKKTWYRDLNEEEREYFRTLDYQAIIDSQDALDTELDPYSSSQFFITD
ncbi:MAG: hypothetical protein ACFFEE_07365 [Candidatus Thorarchaeota archaeon]